MGINTYSYFLYMILTIGYNVANLRNWDLKKGQTKMNLEAERKMVTEIEKKNKNGDGKLADLCKEFNIPVYKYFNLRKKHGLQAGATSPSTARKGLVRRGPSAGVHIAEQNTTSAIPRSSHSRVTDPPSNETSTYRQGWLDAIEFMKDINLVKK